LRHEETQVIYKSLSLVRYPSERELSIVKECDSGLPRCWDKERDFAVHVIGIQSLERVPRYEARVV